MMGMFGHATTTTVIPAAPGFEVISLDAGFQVMRQPIIAWQVTTAGQYVTSLVPIWIGFDLGDTWYGVRLPDGRVVSEASGSPRFYVDAELWAAAIKAPAATAAWRDAGEYTAGEA